MRSCDVGQYPEATIEFKRVLDLVPDHTEAHQRLLQIEELKQEEAAELAIELLRQTAEAAPAEPGTIFVWVSSWPGWGGTERRSRSFDDV